MALAISELIDTTIERPAKASTIVAQRLESLILTRKIRPGVKLPPERSLCEQFGVSRTVLREAIKILSTRGLIDEVPGKGAFISEPNFDFVRSSLQLCLSWYTNTNINHLIELRRLIEVEAVGLAASRATKKEIEDLNQTIEWMERLMHGSVKRFVKLDFDFHKQLAKAAHNELFVMLLEALSEPLQSSWERICRSPEVREHGIGFHKRILVAIEHKDAREARKAMRENLRCYAADFQGLLE